MAKKIEVEVLRSIRLAKGDIIRKGSIADLSGGDYDYYFDLGAVKRTKPAPAPGAIEDDDEGGEDE